MCRSHVVQVLLHIAHTAYSGLIACFSAQKETQNICVALFVCAAKKCFSIFSPHVYFYKEIGQLVRCKFTCCLLAPRNPIHLKANFVKLWSVFKAVKQPGIRCAMARLLRDWPRTYQKWPKETMWQWTYAFITVRDKGMARSGCTSQPCWAFPFKLFSITSLLLSKTKRHCHGNHRLLLDVSLNKWQWRCRRHDNLQKQSESDFPNLR